MNHSTIMPGNNDDDDPPRRPGSRLFGVHDISFILNITYNHENYHPFFAGNDIDGQDLFICRTERFNQIIPGKYSHSIGRCSIPFAQKEWQFNQFELLIESDDTRYEWVKLKKPVIDLPENVLVGGRQFLRKKPKTNKPETTSAATMVALKNAPKFSKIPFEHILSGDLLRKPKMKMINRRHRFKRATQHQLLIDEWSRNWRGVMMSSKNTPFATTNLFTEIPVFPKSLSDHVEETTVPDSNSNPLPINVDKRKLNYFIAKCSLRTGNKISEQIGKIWWKHNIQEWIASFPFGGHEIYCLDYSILTLKTTK